MEIPDIQSNFTGISLYRFCDAPEAAGWFERSPAFKEAMARGFVQGIGKDGIFLSDETPYPICVAMAAEIDWISIFVI